MSQVPTFPEAPPPQPVPLPATGAAQFWHRTADRPEGRLHHHRRRWAGPPARGARLHRAGAHPGHDVPQLAGRAEHTDYFRRIVAAGGVVENHTITHTSLSGRSYDYQKQEICGAADTLEKLFGTRPTLFRPPFGNHDATTLRAAHDCGAKAVFHWTETVHKGKVRYQTPEKVVQPGDVLLMHFRPALMDDLLGGAEGDPPGRAHAGAAGGLRADRPAAT